MLARLLRWTIMTQMVLGAALGYWLGGWVVYSALPMPTGKTLSWPLGLACLLALATPLLLTSAMVSASFLQAGMQRPWWPWLSALRGELHAQLRLFLLRQPWAFAAPAILPATQAPDHQAAGLPVLLLHGLGCNHRVWDDWLPALRAAGHTVLAIDLEPPFASIDQLTAQVDRAVAALCQRTGQQQVALVGHSLGGVLIRAWMQRYGSQHAALAITLGAPHQGTLAHGLVATPASLQLAWQSKWLRALSARENPEQLKLFRIGISRQDNVVHPQLAQTLPGITPTVFEGLGHLQLCTNAGVRQWVCAQLRLG